MICMRSNYVNTIQVNLINVDIPSSYFIPLLLLINFTPVLWTSPITILLSYPWFWSPWAQMRRCCAYRPTDTPDALTLYCLLLSFCNGGEQRVVLDLTGRNFNRAIFIFFIAVLSNKCLDINRLWNFTIVSAYYPTRSKKMIALFLLNRLPLV